MTTTAIIAQDGNGKQAIRNGSHPTQKKMSGGSATPNQEKAEEKLIAEKPVTVKKESKAKETKNEPIKNYSSFKNEVLKIHEKLDREGATGSLGGKKTPNENLVPIFLIRRQLGDRISRQDFDKWMLEMQSKNVFQFAGASLTFRDDSAMRDSLVSPFTGSARVYAKRL